MNPLSVDLHLKDHCIETAAKKKLAQLCGQYFNSDDDSGILLKKIGFLQDFLKKTNFSKMRSDDERLSGDQNVHVRISPDKNDF